MTSFGNTVKVQKSDTLKFAIIADTHIGKPANSIGLRAIIKDINNNPEINFVIHVGDISNFGSDNQLREAKSIMDRLDKPYYLVPGNHDTGWSASGGLIYDKLWKEQKFVTDIAGVRFIGFSTGPYSRMSRGYVPLDQMRWLDSLVRVTPKTKPVIFIGHYPLDSGLSNYKEIINKMNKLNTLAIFCGHGHANKLFDYDGITGIMTQTTQLRQGKLTYNLVNLTKDSLIVKRVEVGDLEPVNWASISVQGKKDRNFVTTDQSGRTPINIEYRKVQVYFDYQDKGNIVSTPAIWKNQVLFGNLLGEFKSLNPETNSINWSFKTTQSIFSSPEVSGNKVVFASADSAIYCLNARNGKLIWRVKTGAPVLASPVIKNNIVYIGGSDSIFRALDLSHGNEIWSFDDMQGYSVSKPSVANGKVVFGTWAKMIYSLNAKNGDLAWKWCNQEYSQFYSPALCVPVIQNAKVYVVAPDEKLREFDLSTGEQTFQTDKFNVRESLGGNDKKDWLLAKTTQDSIVAWSTKRGKPELILNITGDFGDDFSASMPAFYGNIAYFGTTYGRVYAIDVKAKEIKWVYQLSNDMINSVRTLKDGKVIATSVDGKIVILGGEKSNY